MCKSIQTSKTKNLLTKSSQTSSNFKEDFGPTSDLSSLLQVDKNATSMKIKNCDNFLALPEGHFMVSEMQGAIYNLRKTFDAEHSGIIQLFTLFRYVLV